MAAPPSYGHPYDPHGQGMMMSPQPQPIMSQPAPSISNNTVVVNQPAQSPTMVVQSQGGWSTGLCACCEDVTVCCCVMCFPWCYQSHLASKMGESCCVPCCVPGHLVAMRAHFRGKHNIPGSLIDDCCMAYCCFQCVTCQLSREIDRRNATTTTIVSGGVATRI